MRTLLIAAIVGVALVAVNASTSAAADTNGQVPASMLASLGASQMQPMSDAQGMNIRGKGTSRGCCVSSCCRSSCESSCESSCSKSRCASSCSRSTYCRPKCGGTTPV